MIYNTREEAMAANKFILDVGSLPRMLCETLDGKYQWVSLGNYQGRNRVKMTPQEVKQALASAPLIGDYDLEKACKVFYYKRGILVQDDRT